MAIGWTSRSSWSENWSRLEAFGRSNVSKYKKLRRPYTAPLCRLLIRFHINQSQVTLFRLLLLLGFAFLWIIQEYTGSLLILAVYFFLDGIDGDLARALKRDCDLGKFEDLTVDNLMVVTFPFILIWQELIPGFLGAVYIFLVTQSWWYSVIRRKEDWKSDWLFRPYAGPVLHVLRFWVVSILMILYAIWRLDWFTPAVIALSVLIALQTMYDYYQIIKHRLNTRA
jgi:phosphatidylglycerophosphate synthase